MKKHILLTLVFSLITLASLLGQSAKKSLNYQAVILDPKAIDIPGASLSGQPLSKGKVCLKFSFVNAKGNLDYEEIQQTTTDEYGLVSLVVGTGTYNGGTYKNFESIVWDANVKSMRVAVSYDECNSFKQVSTQALNYTPYALYAEAVDYKNVKDAPTKLSQFSNDAGYLIPKDLDPLKADIKTNAADIKTNTADIKTNTADIKTNAGQIASANQSIADNKKSSDESFLVVNQSISDLGAKVVSNTNSIVTIEGKINEQQNIINDTRNQLNTTTNTINNQINGLQNQVNITANSVNSLSNEYQTLANKSTASNLGGSNPSDQLYPSQKAAKTYVDNAIYNAVGTGVADATTLAPGKVRLAGDLAGTANSPTVPALANKENTSNKSTNVSTDGNSDTKYPSAKAVKTYVDQATQGVALQAAVDAKADKNSPVFTGTPNLPTGTIAVTQNGADNSTKIATTAFVQAATAAGIIDATSTTKGKLKLTGDLGGTAESPTVPGLALKANSADVITALALKEDASNKSTTTALGTSDAFYPSQKAVKTYVDAQIASATIADAEASTKGKIQLAGDLGGTASSPTVPGLALKANSADVNNALGLKAPINNPTFTGTVGGITSSMVGLGNVNNTSDASKPVSTATQTALDLKATLASPTFTGSPSLPSGTTAITQLAGDNSTKLATTEFVTTKLAAGAPDATTTATGKIQLTGDLGGTASSPTVPGLALKANSADVNIALGLKANSADVTSSLALKEDASNKSTATALGTSDALYPSQKAVKSYVDAQIASANISIGTIAGTATSNGASITSGVINLAPADGTNGGIVTTGTQTFSGAKTFTTDANVNGITVGKGGGNYASNTAFGNSALSVNTTGGINNTAIGYGSLSSNTSGGSNTAIGKGSLNTNSTGSSITAIGMNALENNTTGSNNTAIGGGALSTNSTGGSNTAIGHGADVGSNNLTNATAIGSGALVTANNTIQLGNIDVTNVKTSGTLTAGAVTYPNIDGTIGQVLSTNGSGSLTWTTPATISIGTIAGTSDPNGASITPSGELNLAPADGTNGGIVTTGTQTFAGAKTFTSDAILNGITVGRGGGNGSTNTAIGLNALSVNAPDNTDPTNPLGSNNTGSGYDALFSNITGTGNTASGYGALKANTTGNYNTASGNAALYSNETGEGNTAIGAAALFSNTAGGGNIAIGSETLASNTTGSSNTAIGGGALASNAAGEFNTAIGYLANVDNPNLTNATAIGNRAIVSVSDMIQLGNTDITNVKTSGTLTAGAVTYPNTDGTIGQVLLTDGNGLASFGSIPVLNQSTTGSAATLTTLRTIHGGSFDGSANVTNIIASTYGGTGNGFTKFSGPTSSEKTFTLPDASATILTSNAVVTVAQGGTGTNNGSITGTSALTFAAGGTNQNVSILASGTGSVGVGTGSPSSSSALDVSSTSKGFLPPRLTTTQRDAITNPVEGLTIWNNINKQLEVYDGTYWVNMNGKLVSTLNVGDSYGGGKVAYIFTSSDPGYVAGQTHGLIAASSDQTTDAGVKWFPDKFYGATGTYLLLGLPNTISIIAAAAVLGTTDLSTFAAGLANSYRGGGYVDWFLPSKDELNKLFSNRVAIGGFATSGTMATYWSSTQKGALSYSNFDSFKTGVASAYQQFFFAYNGNSEGTQNDLGISNLRRVRAVRIF